MSRIRLAGIIPMEDGFALMHRKDVIKNPDRQEYYVFPGGGREGQETPLECLQREVWEELGLTLIEESIIWSKIYPSMLDKDRAAVFVVGRISQEQYRVIRFGDEGQEFKQMPVEDFIKAEGVIPQLQERIKDYLVGKEIDN